jgi:hypothetical protein
MTRAEAAWVAGIFEGEGSFSSKKRPRMTVAMTDFDITQRLRNVTGVGLLFQATPSGKTYYKPVQIWAVQRARHVKGLIEILYPWLGDRRRASADQILLLIKGMPIVGE